MTSLQRNVITGFAIMACVSLVAFVLILRQRNLAGLSLTRDTLSAREDLTPEQIQARQENDALAKQLPQDIRETWTPEFKQALEESGRLRAESGIQKSESQ